MIRLLTAVLLLTYSLFGWASAYPDKYEGVPNTFKDGDIIKAEDFNNNNESIKKAINNISSGDTAGGTAEGDIALTSTAGDVDITADKEVTLSAGFGKVAIVAGAYGASTISLKNNSGTTDTIVVTNSQGDSDASIALESIAGGITLSAGDGITLNSGIGDVTANGQIIATGVVNSSDARLKEAVSSVGVGLGLINDLNPVRYHRINNPESDIEMGLMAQEVAATLAKHGLGNSGMVVQPDDKGYLYLRYNDLLAPMIKAIQELHDASEIKDEQIASLQQKLESQQEELLVIVQSQQEQIAQLQKLVEHQFAMN
jgi:hypothetical protein